MVLDSVARYKRRLSCQKQRRTDTYAEATLLDAGFLDRAP
jgi:hypothetical protein